MDNVLLVITLISLVAFIVGMVDPQNLKMKNRGIVALVCWSVIIICTGLGGGFDEKKNEPNNFTSTTSSEEQEPAQSQENASLIGKEIKVGNFAYRINEFEFKKKVGCDFAEETADGVFLLVYMDLMNISSETRTLDGGMFTVIDSNGRKYEHSANGVAALEMSGHKTLFLKQCQPNIQVGGTLIFEVPSRGDYTIELTGGFWSSKSVKVLLRN